MQCIGPDGMDGHHKWYTTDRLTSSQQQISHGMVSQGNKSNKFMLLLTDLLSFTYETAVKLSQMLKKIVPCSLNIVGHTLCYDDNIILVRLTFVVQHSWHLGLELSSLNWLNLGFLSANEKYF